MRIKLLSIFQMQLYIRNGHAPSLTLLLPARSPLVKEVDHLRESPQVSSFSCTEALPKGWDDAGTGNQGYIYFGGSCESDGC